MRTTQLTLPGEGKSCNKKNCPTCALVRITPRLSTKTPLADIGCTKVVLLKQRMLTSAARVCVLSRLGSIAGVVAGIFTGDVVEGVEIGAAPLLGVEVVLFADTEVFGVVVADMREVELDVACCSRAGAILIGGAVTVPLTSESRGVSMSNTPATADAKKDERVCRSSIKPISEIYIVYTRGISLVVKRQFSKL